MILFCVSVILVISVQQTYGVNVALRAMASQSSTWRSVYSADRAVDGNSARRFFHDTCTHTDCLDTTPYWTVRFERLNTITSVTIFNPYESHWRMNNINIEVFEIDPNTPGAGAKPCGNIGGKPIADGSIRTFQCPAGTWGQYLRIRKSSVISPWRQKSCDALLLCEVEAEGTPFVICQPGFVQNGDSCYYFARQGVLGSWAEARTQCETMGGYLAIIETAAEDDFLRNYLLANAEQPNFWIGANDMLVEGTFRWMSRMQNELVTFTNWAPLQPDNNGGLEHCVELRGPFGYLWNDQTCATNSGYVCEQN